MDNHKFTGKNELRLVEFKNKDIFSHFKLAVCKLRIKICSRCKSSKKGVEYLS